MPEKFKGFEDNCIPFGPAAGAISGLNIEEIKRKILDVAASDAAFVKWGSVTMFRNLGNDGKTYHHNEVTGVTSNSIGLSNPGLNVALQVQKEMQPQVEAKGKELIPSFSTVAGEDPLKILPVMAAKFANIGVKRMEINYSCGNKLSESGGYEGVLGHDIDALFEVDKKILYEINNDVSLIRKLPPYLGQNSDLIPEVAAYYNNASSRALEDNIVVLGLFNSISNQSVLDEYGEPALSIGEDKLNRGSLSGRAFAEMSIRGLKKFRALLSPSVGIISSVGVDSAEQVYRRVDIEGADSSEGVTVLWESERDRKFGQTIADMAYRYHEIRSYSPNA